MGSIKARRFLPGREVGASRKHPESETLNFKVSTAFKKEFKGYAVSQGVTMLELLKEGFELTKHNRRA